MKSLAELDLLTDKFAKLGVNNAPGQEARQQVESIGLRADKIEGTPVDFSHGDVFLT